MKRLFALLLLSLALVVSPTEAAKNRWTVDANTTSCDMVLDTGATVNIPVAAGFCDFDVSGVAVGPHTTKATAKLVDPIWGNNTSAQSTPYAFTRPGQPAVPTAPTLIP